MNLTLPVKKEYFDLIKSGKKLVEYREVKPYWSRRLMCKDYDNIVITLGYPKKDDLSKRIVFKYRGYSTVFVKHEFFDINKRTHLYAIPLEKVK